MEDDFISISPYTNLEVYEHEATALDGLDKKVERGHQAYLDWKKLSYAERAVHFQHLRQMLLNLSEEYGVIASNEMGKPIKEAAKEINKCSDLCDYFSKNTQRHLSTQHIETEFHKSMITFEPLGVLLGVMPWNYPYWQILRFAVPALMAGNAVLIKPAPNVFQCAKALEHLFWEAGFPRDVFQVLYIHESLMTLVMREKPLRGVAFTGSPKGGAAIAEMAGKYLKKAVLELGGNDAFIILEDAKIKSAVDAVVASRFNNCGQTCVSAKRLILVESIADEVLPILKSAVEELKLGNPLDKDTDLGPLARPDLVENLARQVKETVELGAKVLTGGKRIKDTNFFEATILTDIPKDSPSYTEELFGPVLSVFIVKNEAQAVALANDSEYGLGASIWTSDLKRGEKLAKKIEAGTVSVNGIVKSDPRLPFGGIKKSGYGRELGAEGIREFVNIKTIIVD